jgi:hypothetical protein
MARKKDAKLTKALEDLSAALSSSVIAIEVAAIDVPNRELALQQLRALITLVEGQKFEPTPEGVGLIAKVVRFTLAVVVSPLASGYVGTKVAAESQPAPVIEIPAPLQHAVNECMRIEREAAEPVTGSADARLEGTVAAAGTATATGDAFNARAEARSGFSPNFSEPFHARSRDTGEPADVVQVTDSDAAQALDDDAGVVTLPTTLPFASGAGAQPDIAVPIEPAEMEFTAGEVTPRVEDD